jgi:hypothetical protein
MAVPRPRLRGYTINGKSIQCIFFVPPCSLISQVFCQLCYHAKKISAEDAYREGQRLMGRTSHTLGTLLPGSLEDKRFHGYFGVSAEVAVEAWEMTEELDCLPPLPQFQHYLWVLAFMQLYPANGSALSSTLGGSDPKMIKKYIWPLIQSIFDLEGVVVSCLCMCCLIN